MKQPPLPQPTKLPHIVMVFGPYIYISTYPVRNTAVTIHTYIYINYIDESTQHFHKYTTEDYCGHVNHALHRLFEHKSFVSGANVWW